MENVVLWAFSIIWLQSKWMQKSEKYYANVDRMEYNQIEEKGDVFPGEG